MGFFIVGYEWKHLGLHPHPTLKSHLRSSICQHQHLVSIRAVARRSVFIEHATEALSDSDKSTLTEHTNLSDSLPNLRLTAIGLANVERS